MDRFISWWCNLIGISDPMAQNVAAGIIAAAVLIAILGIILKMLSAFLRE
jgi:hypothetical protein